MTATAYKKPVILYSAAGGLVVLLLIVPLKNTFNKISELNRLQHSVSQENTSASLTINSMGNELLEKTDDHEKKIFEAVSSASQRFNVIVARIDPPQSSDVQEVIVL